MTLLVYLQGALEPVEINEPLSATMTNMTAALQQNTYFFLANNMKGENEALRVAAIYRIREIDD